VENKKDVQKSSSPFFKPFFKIEGKQDAKNKITFKKRTKTSI
jgi:hypothetical protein